MKKLIGFSFIFTAIIFGQTTQKPMTKPNFGPPAKQNVAARPKVPQPPTGLTVSQVVQLVQAGLSEDVIVAKIKKNNRAFDLSTEELLKLKEVKTSENIILLLMDPAAQPKVAPLPPPPAPAPASKPVATPETAPAPRVIQVPVQPKEKDLAAPHVPEQAGMYYLNSGELVKVDLKTMASSKVAGRLGHQLTFGIKSVKTNAYLIGPSAKTRMKDTSPVFYLRLPEGHSIDEVVLVNLYVKTDRRELEVSAIGGIVGAKQGLRMEVMKPFDSQETTPGLYKIVTSILGRGEYLFYLVGSGDAMKGIQGKGYDFGVD